MRIRALCMAGVAAGLLLAAGGRAEAQGLTDVMSRLLSNNCAALGPGGTGPYGPELANICAFPPTGGGASSGGTAGSESRLTTTTAEQRLQRRTRERRAGASADGDRGFGFFASADYEKFDKDNTRFETGFVRDTVGGTFGVDYVLNPSVIFGGAFTYAHEFGDYDGVGGGFDHDSYGGLLFTSLSPLPGFFVDLTAGYIRKDYGYERRASFIAPAPPGGRTVAAFGATEGDTHGDEIRVGVSGGYDFTFGAVTIGPRLGVNYRDQTVDGFAESGRTGLELVYDNQNIVSLTTNAGLFGAVAISTGFGVIVPQASVEYVHEFLDDQRSVGFRLAQDLGGRRFLFQTDTPDRDYVNLSVGASVVLRDGLTAFVNYRELLGYRDRSSHAVSLGVRVAF
jgi:outer membrane autotransporter protein